MRGALDGSEGPPLKAYTGRSELAREGR